MSGTINVISWNVNGLRSAFKKGFPEWAAPSGADIICLQETKLQEDQLTEQLINIPGYRSYWSCAVKKGYSGVAVYAKIKPQSVSTTLGIERFDEEGRFMRLDYEGFTLFNVYFPNGKMGPERLKFKLDFYDAFIEMTQELRKTQPRLLFVGDVNTAHNEIDIARPKANSKISGFLPIERAWMDKVVDAGYIDTFRYFYPDTVQYSWWDLKSGARKRNVGWRLDYVFVTSETLSSVKRAYILPEVMGSDHCPVGVELEIQ